MPINIVVIVVGLMGIPYQHDNNNNNNNVYLIRCPY